MVKKVITITGNLGAHHVQADGEMCWMHIIHQLEAAVNTHITGHAGLARIHTGLRKTKTKQSRIYKAQYVLYKFEVLAYNQHTF